MNFQVNRPGVLTGALAGLLATVPLAAVFYLADRLAGLAFVPFDVFDWMARVLPGGVITFGIDMLIALIGGVGLGPTAAVAKAAEQLLALVLFLGLGIGIGAIFFLVLWARAGRLSGLRAGLILGSGVGVLVALVSLGVNQTATAPQTVSAAWVLAAFLGWGAAFGWMFDRLSAPLQIKTMPESALGEFAPVASVESINRRQFLIRVGGAAAMITLVGAGLGAALNTRRETVWEAVTEAVPSAGAPPDLPNADDPVQPAPGTRPEYTPVEDHYQVSINLRAPVRDVAAWTLAITGLVDNPLTLTLDDIRSNYAPIDRYVTLSCISNPVGGDLIGTTRWTGASLRAILDDAGLQPQARFLKITSADGFHEMLDLSILNTDERIMLCYDWDGQPLTEGHGAPLRIYIPDRYGMKQPKWIIGIEATDTYEEGYWVRRGWDEVARMQATSVIDTVAADDLIEDGDQTWVPIGGIAHAGDRGISRVEVQVDDGAWVEAQLRGPLSDTTWVIWRYDWPFQAGPHTFKVRCYEGGGALQSERSRGAHPSGATGIHVRRLTV